jgi:hypothetical protein
MPLSLSSQGGKNNFIRNRWLERVLEKPPGNAHEDADAGAAFRPSGEIKRSSMEQNALEPWDWAQPAFAPDSNHLE